MAGDDKSTTKLERILTHIKKNVVLVGAIVGGIIAIWIAVKPYIDDMKSPQITAEMMDSLRVSTPGNIHRTLDLFVPCGEKSIVPLLDRLEEICKDKKQREAIVRCLKKLDQDDVWEKTTHKTKELFDRELDSDNDSFYMLNSFANLLGDIGKNNKEEAIAFIEELKNDVDKSDIHTDYKDEMKYWLDDNKKNLTKNN